MNKIEGLSVEVCYVFSVAKLNRVWPQLDRVIPRTQSQQVVKQIWDEYGKMDNKTRGPESTYFLRRSQELINPLLNEKLGREKDFPTWNNLLAYALRDFIDREGHARSLGKGVEQDDRFKLYESTKPIP